MFRVKRYCTLVIKYHSFDVRLNHWFILRPLLTTILDERRCQCIFKGGTAHNVASAAQVGGEQALEVILEFTHVVACDCRR